MIATLPTPPLPETASASCAPISPAELSAIVSAGISQRGFHICDGVELEGLWAAERLSPTEKLQRLHGFATENGWEVAAKDRVSSVLFQGIGRRAVLPGMWRLCGLK